jgi:hypothetical protein
LHTTPLLLDHTLAWHAVWGEKEKGRDVTRRRRTVFSAGAENKRTTTQKKRK